MNGMHAPLSSSENRHRIAIDKCVGTNIVDDFKEILHLDAADEVR